MLEPVQVWPHFPLQRRPGLLRPVRPLQGPFQFAALTLAPAGTHWTEWQELGACPPLGYWDPFGMMAFQDQARAPKGRALCQTFFGPAVFPLP